MKRIVHLFCLSLFLCFFAGILTKANAQPPSAGGCFNSTFTIAPISCPNDIIPFIVVNPNTGTPPYTYNWSTGATGDTLFNVPQGIYIVTISDGVGCTESDTVNAVLLTPFNTSAIITPSTCVGSVGAIDLSVSGAGGGPFTFAWSNGAMTEDISNLAGGNYTVTITDNNNCDHIETFNVTGGPLQTVDLGPALQSTCEATYVLDAGPGFFAYNWSTGATTQSISINTPGTYSVICFDSNSCSSTDTVIVSFFTKPTVTIQPSGNVEICQGSSVVLDAFDNNLFIYEWNTGQTSADITVDSAGSFFVVGTNGDGCSDTSNIVNVLVNPLPMVSLGPDTGYCVGGTVTITPGPGYSSYLWSTNETTETVDIGIQGGYWVEVTDANGCAARDTIIIGEFNLPTANIGGDSTYCFTDSLVLDPGPGFVGYQWNTGATSQTIVPGQSGPYNVVVQDNRGCFGSSNTVIITILPAPAVPTITTQSGDLVSSAATTYQWYYEGALLPGETNQNHTPADAGYYQVEVTDANGCGSTFSDSLLFLFELTTDNFPQGISPNGDGVHDFFEIKFLSFFPDNELIIINRWGSEVYSMTNYNNTWNGVSNSGKDLPDGTYFFVFKPSGTDQEPVSGYVVINR